MFCFAFKKNLMKSYEQRPAETRDSNGTTTSVLNMKFDKKEEDQSAAVVDVDVVVVVNFIVVFVVVFVDVS